MSHNIESPADKLAGVMSPCHFDDILIMIAEGVDVGVCKFCFRAIARINPHTNTAEWLDGESPWTEKPLREVDLSRLVSREDLVRLRELGMIVRNQNRISSDVLNELAELTIKIGDAILGKE